MKKVLKKYWWILVIVLTMSLIIARMQHLRNLGQGWADWTDFKDKKLWQILELIIIPLTLAAIAIVMEYYERKTDRKIAQDNQAKDRELNLDNQRERLLQNYFESLTGLILDKNLKESKPKDEVREIARIKTLTTLKRLDSDRRSSLLEFLCEIELIQGKSGSNPIISLKDANLKGVRLVGACLINANLVSAQLQSANLMLADLRGAKLVGARLQGAHLEGAHLDGAILGFAKFEEAIMPDGKEYDPEIHTIDNLTGLKSKGK